MVKQRTGRALFFASALCVLLATLAWLGLNLAGVRPAAAAPGDNNALVCHQPPPGPFWLWIDESAVPGHLQHGDKRWVEGMSCGGVIYEPPGPEVTAQVYLPIMYPSCSRVLTGPYCP